MTKERKSKNDDKLDNIRFTKAGVYVFRNDISDPRKKFKIGCSDTNIYDREQKHKGSCPEGRLMYYQECKNPRVIEKTVLAHLRTKYEVMGEVVSGITLDELENVIRETITSQETVASQEVKVPKSPPNETRPKTTPNPLPLVDIRNKYTKRTPNATEQEDGFATFTRALMNGEIPTECVKVSKINEKEFYEIDREFYEFGKTYDTSIAHLYERFEEYCNLWGYHSSRMCNRMVFGRKLRATFKIVDRTQCRSDGTRICFTKQVHFTVASRGKAVRKRSTPLSMKLRTRSGAVKPRFGYPA